MSEQTDHGFARRVILDGKIVFILEQADRSARPATVNPVCFVRQITERAKTFLETFDAKTAIPEADLGKGIVIGEFPAQ